MCSDMLPTQTRRGLLGQQVARQHFLPRALVVLSLELKHRLRLILRQPHGLKVEVCQGKGQVLQPGWWKKRERVRAAGRRWVGGCVAGVDALPVSCNIQHVQLGGVGQLSGQFAEAVVPQREDVEAGAAPQLFGHVAQAVAVYIQVGQLLQLAQRARKRLRGKSLASLSDPSDAKTSSSVIIIIILPVVDSPLGRVQ